MSHGNQRKIKGAFIYNGYICFFLEIIGTVAFASSGAMTAIEKRWTFSG